MSKNIKVKYFMKAVELGLVFIMMACGIGTLLTGKPMIGISLLLFVAVLILDIKNFVVDKFM